MKRSFIFVSLLFCLFLSACGGSSASTTAGSNANAASGTTPASTNTSLVLHVTRTDPSPTDNLGPLDKTVTDTQTVENLYHAAFALPAYAVGSSISQSCLSDTGVIYHLDFLQGSTEVQKMNLDPGDCKILYLSQTDLRQVSDAFLTQLKQAIGVNSLTS